MNDKPIAAGKSSFDLIDRERLFALLQLTPDSVVLDVASGSGNYSLAVAEALQGKGHVYAVDLWEEGIAELRRRAAAKDMKNISASVADVTREIPMADSIADICLIATVLHDLLQEQGGEGALKEIARVMKPGGRLVVVEFNKIEGPPGPPMDVRLSPEELDALVIPSGFDMIENVGSGPHLYFSAYLRRDSVPG